MHLSQGCPSGWRQPHRSSCPPFGEPAVSPSCQFLSHGPPGILGRPATVTGPSRDRQHAVRVGDGVLEQPTDGRCYLHADGRSCTAPPLTGGTECFWHDPDKSEEAAEARRVGGLRRRRDKTIAGLYGVAGLGDVGSIRRLLEIATLDTLGLDNSIARSKVLIGAVATSHTGTRSRPGG